jgi:sec-independent protein translocase protein TatA
MLSIPDMAMLGAAALLLFGPEQLPRVARKAGNVMREIQNTSQSFIREMERAADLQDEAAKPPYEPPAYDPVPYDAAAYDGKAYDDTAAYGVPSEPAAFDDAPTVAMPAVTQPYEPPAPDPERPAGAIPKPVPVAKPAPAAEPERYVSEKLAEPRPALDLQTSETAEPAPQGEHAPHL